MKKAQAPLRSLVLHDINDDTTLTVAHSNQGEPYRQTLLFSFERGAHGSFATYEHLASVELEPDEEDQLRDLLNARLERIKSGRSCC